ncbi:DNA polymerase beta superfamily protein [Alkalihalobacillus deserti]|uniref:DNA polymerase beta superfamily protein n=1 Tax=Alkalihalobacillus deserti TaxID=2879466 RepID=UPI001D14E3A3|nr:nucleotidyltransferase domain-containing protein [Alkalihalobacillus deserti]
MEREIAFKALVGSANYNLATPESDKDYKVFVIPMFADLYHGKLYAESKVGETIDEEFHDIRKLVHLFWKSNVNFVEVLFSIDMTINQNRPINNYIQQIIAQRDEIATMNLPYLYRACKGMYESKKKYIKKGNKGTRYLVEKVGFDSKSAMHAYRILDFIERFSANEFTSFKEAIQYDDKSRKFMIGIKNGLFTKDQYDEIMKEKLTVFQLLEKKYMEQPSREEVKETVANILYKMIAQTISLEIQKSSFRI